VDEVRDPGIARTKLDWWRTEVDRMGTGSPQHPVTQALAPHVEPFGLSRSRLREVIDGMQMDLDQNRYFDYTGLALYCRRVAGVVGEMASGIFGGTGGTGHTVGTDGIDPRTLQYADALGLAFQLTNIIRDVGEDARRGRIYLPLEDLQRFGVGTADILASRRTDAFVAMMQFQAARAREQYRRAYLLLPEADRRAQRPGLIMAAIYSTLLDEIERDGFQVLDRHTSLTPIRKLLLAWRTWVTGRPPGFPPKR
jgi:15-cis-phytoene synthase